MGVKFGFAHGLIHLDTCTIPNLVYKKNLILETRRRILPKVFLIRWKTVEKKEPKGYHKGWTLT